MYESEKWQITEGEREKYISALTEKLAALRVRAGISQGDLAQVIGISRQTYSALENGRRKMPWDIYLALVFFFSLCKETRYILELDGIYPSELAKRFNNGAPAFFDSLSWGGPHADEMFDKLDSAAKQTILAVLQAELIRCTGITGEEALRKLDEDRKSMRFSEMRMIDIL